MLTDIEAVPEPWAVKAAAEFWDRHKQFEDREEWIAQAAKTFSDAFWAEHAGSSVRTPRTR